MCYVHTRDRIRDKFDARATRCMFIGYPQGKKGWRVFELDTQRTFVSWYVIFHEDIYPFAQTHLTGIDPNSSSSSNPQILSHNFVSEPEPSSFFGPISPNPVDDPLLMSTVIPSASLTSHAKPNATSPTPHISPHIS